jgi:hypothetical protein
LQNNLIRLDSFPKQTEVTAIANKKTSTGSAVVKFQGQRARKLDLAKLEFKKVEGEDGVDSETFKVTFENTFTEKLKEFKFKMQNQGGDENRARRSTGGASQRTTFEFMGEGINGHGSLAIRENDQLFKVLFAIEIEKGLHADLALSPHDGGVRFFEPGGGAVDIYGYILPTEDTPSLSLYYDLIGPDMEAPQWCSTDNGDDILVGLNGDAQYQLPGHFFTRCTSVQMITQKSHVI